MIILIIIGLIGLWLIEQQMINNAEHMDRMEEKENNETNYINNTYNGNVDAVNDAYNFP